MKKNNQHIPLVDLPLQYRFLQNEFIKAFEDVSSAGLFKKGPYLEKFEKEFAHFIGVKYCIGVASGTDALHLSLLALGVGKDDEVILPANTFIATVYAVLFTGAKPVLVDVDESNHTINTKLLEQYITKKTRAIIPVHLYGYPADMDTILGISKKYNLAIIEDSCQAHGALYKKRTVGSFGNAGAFSFYPSKNLGAFGDAGAITTNSVTLAKKLRKLREYGGKSEYVYDEIGFNSRLDGLQAAILSIKLKHLKKWNQEKIKKALYYTLKLQEKLPVILTPLQTDKSIIPVYHLYVIRTKRRNKLLQYLKSKGIYAGIHYPIPLHLQKSLVSLGYKKGDFPVTEKLCNEILSLPIYPELTTKQQDYVIESLCSFFVV